MSKLIMIQNRKHPHYGEVGYLDEFEGANEYAKEGEKYFKLAKCQHGLSGCYVTLDDITAPAAAGLETEVLVVDPDATRLGSPGRGGRPTDMTPPVINKLILAFSNGWNITEACAYAGISRPTYYLWLEKDDQFSYKMSQAQSTVSSTAKKVVVESIKSGDIATAKWFLERRDPEYSSKLAVRPEDPASQKREDALKEFMDDTDDGAYSDGTDDVSAEPSTPALAEGGGEVAQSPTDIHD